MWCTTAHRRPRRCCSSTDRGPRAVRGNPWSRPAPSYDVPDQADRVAAVLDELGLREVVTVGHSSGGYVATALAERRPDLVRSLALISTGPRTDALLPQPLI